MILSSLILARNGNLEESEFQCGGRGWGRGVGSYAARPGTFRLGSLANQMRTKTGTSRYQFTKCSVSQGGE